MTARFLSALLLVSSIPLFAQSPQGRQGQGFGSGAGSGSLSGQLMDEETRHPIEYGNVVLFRVKDSVMVTGTISGRDGKFRMEKVPFGRYFCKISFIGYETRVVSPVQVNPKSPDPDLGSIYLNLTPVNLKEVLVTGEKEMIVNNLDKKVINVDKSIAATGGSAVDVMQNIPAVTVDSDGGVKLRGNKNVTVLIDGKPSAMEGVSTGEILAQIPASSMESVELVTNPSAKYDPEGTAGIINIVLKKKQESGYNTVVTLNAGNGDRYNGSLNLNYRTGGWNFYGSLDGRWNRFKAEGNSNRQTTLPDTSRLTQDSRNTNQMTMNGFRTGIDYSPDEWNTFSAGFRGRNMGFDNSGDMNNFLFDGNQSLVRSFNRESDADRNGQHLEYSLEHKRTWETKGREWTTDLEFGTQKMKRTESASTLNSAGSGNYLSKQKNTGSNTGLTLSLESNYAHPTPEWGRFEAGFKSRFRQNDSEGLYDTLGADGMWYPNSFLTDKFDYTEQVHAGYGTYSNSLEEFKFQLALRGEYVRTVLSSRQFTSDFTTDYTSLYPSIHISRELSEAHELMVSYSRRVDRPNNRQLNPFVDYSDSLNLRSGNPKLLPQYTNSMEFGYNFNQKMTSLSASLFYRQTEDLISEITRQENARVTRTTLENAATGTSVGVDLSANQTISQGFRLNGGISWFRNVNKGKLESDNADADNVSWNAKGSAMITLPLEIQLQVMGNYNAPMVMPQRKIKEQYSVDFGLKRDFLDGMLTANLRVQDVFDSREFDSETTGPGFTLTSYNKPDSRTIFLGITWRISTLMMNERERQKNREPENDDF